jgi:hypothetical protein
MAYYKKLYQFRRWLNILTPAKQLLAVVGSISIRLGISFA